MNQTDNECPCCGKASVEEYEICPVCNWENDPIQTLHPYMAGGANKMTLEEARAAFLAGRAVE